MPRFLDFHLMVNKVAGDDSDRFVVAVVEAPVPRFGQAFGELTLIPSDRSTWLAKGSPLVFTRDLEQRFQTASKNKEEIGAALFRLLFPVLSPSRDLLGQSCLLLAPTDYLRLKLELHHELSNLPWELMECPLSELPWALPINKASLSILRYLGNVSASWSGTQPEGGQKPSIIIVKADPEKISQREVTDSLWRELVNVRNALDRMQDRVSYHVIDEQDTLNRLVNLAHQLKSSGSPVIGLHFMGHGCVDERGGFFAGEGSGRSLQPIYARDLMNALNEAESIRWVILNACSTAAEPAGSPLSGLATSMAILKDIPTVIAYQRPVATKDAEILAADFYEQVIGQQKSVEEVVRSVQSRCETPGGLVVLARSVEGRIQDVIHVDGWWDSTVRPPSTKQESSSESAAIPGTEPREPAVASPAVPSEMVPVPTGPFRKGLTPEQIESLLIQFERADPSINITAARSALSREALTVVDLPAFRISKALVTNEQFARFVAATHYRTDAERAGDPRSWRVYNTPEMANHPVVYVSYNDAEAYCRWAGKRLPTADQWKKAYRGTDGGAYPWGEAFDAARCNTAEGKRDLETTPVDMFPQGASPYGCLDMVGNVEEWTVTSLYDGRKAIFGGSWAMTCQIYGLPVLYRQAAPSFYSNDLGFRCVVEEDPVKGS